MLIQTDITELGDRRLNPEEAVIREREELLSLASKRKVWGQRELEDQERSAGPRMFYTEFIRRIRTVNPDILVVEGSAGNVALYIPKSRKELERELREEGRSTHRYAEHVYAGGLEKQALPEFSHVILDSSELPVREYRGWRTPLLSLIKCGALSYDEAVTLFGEPVGSRSSRWFDQMRDHKFYHTKRFQKENN